MKFIFAWDWLKDFANKLQRLGPASKVTIPGTFEAYSHPEFFVCLVLIKTVARWMGLWLFYRKLAG